MRFSLILGTVGRTDELNGILASLSTQTYQNFELIVVDQNPDERLAPILASYKDAFPILHLRSERGLNRAKNLGLAHVSGDIIGFPDDNCQYPSDHLEKVVGFFTRHPEADGLTGRAEDKCGRNSTSLRNGPVPTEPSAIDKINVWTRCCAYNIFLRTSSGHGVRFDEKLGPGAGTVWGASDDMDYLLQLLSRGASLYYDPDLVAIHPSPKEEMEYDSNLMYKAYSHGCGMGYVLRRHKLPLWLKAWWVARALGGVLLFGARGRILEATYYWNVFTGRLKGLL